MQGVSERLATLFRKRDIRLHSKARLAIRNLVVTRKDPLEVNEQCGVVYQTTIVTHVEKFMWGRQADP